MDVNICASPSQACVKQETINSLDIYSFRGPLKSLQLPQFA